MCVCVLLLRSFDAVASHCAGVICMCCRADASYRYKMPRLVTKVEVGSFFTVPVGKVCWYQRSFLRRFDVKSLRDVHHIDNHRLDTVSSTLRKKLL